MNKPNLIEIPRRKTLAEFGDPAYFSETASPFERHPEFGTAVAHVIATASLLDLEMLRLAVSQHGKESILAIKTAFAALDRDERKRRDYIRRLAEETGKELVWETIQWAYSYCQPVFSIRNQFAHHIWGECPSLPDAILLAAPMDRLNGQAALVQLLAHTTGSDAEVQTITRILTGEGGSKLSETDASALIAMVIARQNDPGRVAAFNATFDNPLDFRAPEAEVWTAADFRNALHASSLARTHVLGRLQQLSQWLHGLRSADELEPLPPSPSKNRRR